MTTDQLILFALFGMVFAMLLWGKFRYDLVAFSALLIGVVLGVIPTVHHICIGLQQGIIVRKSVGQDWPISCFGVGKRQRCWHWYAQANIDAASFDTSLGKNGAVGEI